LPYKGTILKNYNLGYAKKKLENAFKTQKLSVKTTYHEFNRYLLSAVENNTLEEFQADLSSLVEQYPYHLMAWRFLAKANVQLGNYEDASVAYHKVLELYNPKKAGRSSHLLFEEIHTYAINRNVVSLVEEAAKKLAGLSVYDSFDGTIFKTDFVSKISKEGEKLLKEANRLFSASKFQNSIERFLEYEKKFGYPGPKFSIWIINSARAVKNDELIIRYAIKGFSQPEIKFQERENILIMSLPAFRRKEYWFDMGEYITEYLFDNPNRPAKLILRAYIESQLKLNDYGGSIRALNLFLKNYPDDSATKNLRDELTHAIENEGLIDTLLDPTDSMVSGNLYPEAIIDEPQAIIDEPQEIIDEPQEIIDEPQEMIEPEPFESMELLDIRFKPEELEKLRELGPEEKEKFQAFFKGFLDKYSLEPIQEKLDIELIEERAYEISPMLRADVMEHEFTDAKIIEQGKQPTLKDAVRLYDEANNQLELAREKKKATYPYYPQFREAAKAFSSLELDKKSNQKYLTCLSSYSALYAGGFYSAFIELMVSISKGKNVDEKIITGHIDSAVSFYTEALRLELDRENELSKEVISKFFKIHFLYAKFINGQAISKEDIKGGLEYTLTSIVENQKLLNEFSIALVRIGSANQKNYNTIFGTFSRKSIFYGFKPKSILTTKEKEISNSALSLIDLSDEERIQIKKEEFAALMKFIFDKYASIIESVQEQFQTLQEYSFNVIDLPNLEKEWEKINLKENVFQLTDKKSFTSLGLILKTLQRYRGKSDPEQVAIIANLKTNLSGIIKKMDEYPTFWKRTALIPIAERWLISVKEMEERRTDSIIPRIKFDFDPPYIVRQKNGEGLLYVNIINKGNLSALDMKVTLDLTFKDAKGQGWRYDHNEVIQGELIPDSQEQLIIEFDKAQVDGLSESIYIGASIIAEIPGLNPFKDLSTLSIRDYVEISENDIPWNETAKVKDDMFFGRSQLIADLKKHYLSRNRIETYILYGLTRHGKSSIHEHLSKQLLLKEIETPSGKKKILPFFWSFATASSNDNARDMWNYLVDDTIFEGENDFRPGLDIYISNGTIPDILSANKDLERLKSKSPKRNIHFPKVLQALSSAGYFPFIAIDEFSYYKVMVDNDLVQPAFLQQIREITIDSQTASFIFAGVYDLIDMIKHPQYGITSQLANTKEIQIGPIEASESEKLINVSEKISFSDNANRYIRDVTNNIPYFIQMVCRRCGWYALEKGRDMLGLPEVEKVIGKMVGENKDELGQIEEITNQFRDTQFRQSENEKFINAVISTIALDSKSKKVGSYVGRDAIIQKWAQHRQSENLKSGALGELGFIREITESLETLVRRGVIHERDNNGILEYKLNLELFRRWWCQQYSNLDSELDKLIQR